VSREYIYEFYFGNKIKKSIIDPLVNQNNPAVNQNKPLYKCKYCGKKDFSYKQSLSRHEIHRCKKNINNNQEYNNLKELVNLLNDQLLEQKKELKSQKEEHQKQINELIKKTGINIGTQNIQNNIKILAYKNTDISHLTEKDYLYCLNRSNMCIPNLIKRIHFDPKKPENHNIYISNIKNKYIMIYDGNQWILNDQGEAINDIIDTNEFVLEQKLEEWIENGKDYPEIMKKFNRYLEKKEKDDVINKIKDEIKLLLYNNRKVVNGQIDI
jgi:hypothetical protein